MITEGEEQKHLKLGSNCGEIVSIQTSFFKEHFKRSYPAPQQMRQNHANPCNLMPRCVIVLKRQQPYESLRVMTLNKPRFLDPRSDLVFKKIFGQHPELTKSFLNSVLPLPEGRLIESVTYLTPEQAPRIPSMKNTIVDVKCTDQQGRIFIVEMQMTWSKNFMKRFLFGTSKAYVQQLGSGKVYSDLCPVYGLAIVNQEFEESTQDWFHHYRLTNTKDLDKTLEGIELVFLELPKFSPQTFEHRKVGVLWLRFLRETKDLNVIPEEFKDSPEVIKAIELAEESAYTPAELEAYDEYLDAIRVEQTVRQDSYEEGREEERQKGEKKMEEEKMNIARKILAKGVSAQEVSEMTGLSIKIVESLKKTKN